MTMGEPVTNTEKITPEMVKARRLVFYPKSEAEAMVIQERLAKLGGVWSTGAATGAHLAACVEKGFVCEYGKFYFEPSKNGGGLLCSAAQLEEGYIPPEPEKDFLLAQFNKMAAKIDALTAQVCGLQEEVAGLKAELRPDAQDAKNTLKKPAAPGQGNR
jgi:hypothetical protein